MAPGGCGASWFIVGEEDMTTAMVAARVARAREKKRSGSKDGFGSDTNEIGFGCHLLPHFNLDTNANADLIGYEYKTDSSNPDSDPDIF